MKYAIMHRSTYTGYNWERLILTADSEEAAREYIGTRFPATAQEDIICQPFDSIPADSLQYWEEAQEAPKTADIIQAVADSIESEKTRSAWAAGVKVYALELLEDLQQNVTDGYTTLADLQDRDRLKADLLNGAPNWKEYSWGGSSLIYDGDIARRLCAPWELRKTRNGEKDPGPREQWLDTQARALTQAAGKIQIAIAAELQKGAMEK